MSQDSGPRTPLTYLGPASPAVSATPQALVGVSGGLFGTGFEFEENFKLGPVRLGIKDLSCLDTDVERGNEENNFEGCLKINL